MVAQIKPHTARARKGRETSRRTTPARLGKKPELQSARPQVKNKDEDEEILKAPAILNVAAAEREDEEPRDDEVPKPEDWRKKKQR